MDSDEVTMLNFRTLERDYSGHVTFWQLLELAARAKLGEDILIIKNPFFARKAQDINFSVRIVSKETEPREVTRTVVDIIIKEYVNRGKEGQDETIVKASKKSSITAQNLYNFFTTEGVDFGFSDNIGAQIMDMSVSGGTAQYNKSVSAEVVSNERDTRFNYEQEEKITVPPGKRMKAKITTYSIKYEMNYTLKFNAYSNDTISVWYKTKCQQFCFGSCTSTCSVLVGDMISVLPNYNGYDENGTASFTQAGTLSWVGEAYSVDKVEELI